jgi:hypothetical protein
MTTAIETTQIESRWEEYKQSVIGEVWKATTPIAGCAITVMIAGAIGMILGWKTFGLIGLGFLGLAWFAQKAKYTIPGIILDIFTMVSFVGVVAYLIYSRENRDGWVTIVLVILLILYELYLFNRAGSQIMFRNSRVEVRVIDGLHYPMLPNPYAFEWFASKVGRAGALISVRGWSVFREELPRSVKNKIKFQCCACFSTLKLAGANEDLQPCGVCSQAEEAILIYDHPVETDSSDGEEANDIAKTNMTRVPCSNCASMILPETAKRYDGLCKPCWKKS